MGSLMSRHHTIWQAADKRQFDIPFTVEEEKARDIEETRDKKDRAAAAALEATNEALLQKIESPGATLQDVLALLRVTYGQA